jgi:hypothetical protein
MRQSSARRRSAAKKTRKNDSTFHRAREFDSSSWGKSEKMNRYSGATLASESADY